MVPKMAIVLYWVGSQPIRLSLLVAYRRFHGLVSHLMSCDTAIVRPSASSHLPREHANIAMDQGQIEIESVGDLQLWNFC